MRGHCRDQGKIFFPRTDRDVVLVLSACFTPRLRERRGPSSAGCASETKPETPALLHAVSLQFLPGTASQPARRRARSSVCPAFRRRRIPPANPRLIGRSRTRVIPLGCGAEAGLEQEGGRPDGGDGTERGAGKHRAQRRAPNSLLRVGPGEAVWETSSRGVSRQPGQADRPPVGKAGEARAKPGLRRAVYPRAEPSPRGRETAGTARTSAARSGGRACAERPPPRCPRATGSRQTRLRLRIWSSRERNAPFARRKLGQIRKREPVLENKPGRLRQSCAATSQR